MFENMPGQMIQKKQLRSITTVFKIRSGDEEKRKDEFSTGNKVNKGNKKSLKLDAQATKTKKKSTV